MTIARITNNTSSFLAGRLTGKEGSNLYEIAIIITVPIMSFLLGVYLLKGGIEAFKNDEKAIGPYIPKANLFLGIFLIIIGIAVGFRLLIM